MWTDNPVRDAESYFADQERWLMRRPKCAWCGEHIQDEKAYKINDEVVCPDCIEETKFYMED